MSVPKSLNDEAITREQAITQVIASIAMEEIGLSNIIKAEGEKLQYALGTIPGVKGPCKPPTIEELLSLNESVRETLNSAAQSQMSLNSKLQTALSASMLQGPTGATGETGATGATGPTGPFFSCYFEILGDAQTVGVNRNIVFDTNSADDVGNAVDMSQDGTVFSIRRTGLYQIEWTLNLSPTDTAVVGIMENGEPASGASCSASGNFSSGTLIYVDTVPFTISLYNYNNEITISNVLNWDDSAASLRIIRFADGPL